MAATNGPSPLLALPRETRDQIYRELLTPTIGIGNVERDSYGLEPSILRVNRQMHAEASEVLYNESCWILFTTSCADDGMFEQVPSYTHKPTVVLPNGKSSFGGQFAMQIDITTRPEFPDHDSEGLAWILASVYDLPGTLSGLVLYIQPSRFKLTVSIHDRFQKHPQHQERILECLRGVRGAERASVHGNQLNCLDKEIERQMMTQYKHPEECTERLRTYQRRGDRQVALGKHFEAAIIYEDGHLESFHHLRAFPNIKAEPLDWNTQISVLYTASALCSIKLGYIEDVRLENSKLLYTHRMPDAQRATAFYVQGLAFLAEDLYMKASNSFTQALMLRPEYEAVIQEVDRMGAKLGILEEQDNTSCIFPLPRYWSTPEVFWGLINIRRQ